METYVAEDAKLEFTIVIGFVHQKNDLCSKHVARRGPANIAERRAVSRINGDRSVGENLPIRKYTRWSWILIWEEYGPAGAWDSIRDWQIYYVGGYASGNVCINWICEEL